MKGRPNWKKNLHFRTKTDTFGRGLSVLCAAVIWVVTQFSSRGRALRDVSQRINTHVLHTLRNAFLTLPIKADCFLYSHGIYG